MKNRFYSVSQQQPKTTTFGNIFKITSECIIFVWDFIIIIQLQMIVKKANILLESTVLSGFLLDHSGYWHSTDQFTYQTTTE